MFRGVIYMKDTDFIGNRALNDYTANYSKSKKKKFIEPKKVDICIWSSSPMEVNNIKNKRSTTK